MKTTTLFLFLLCGILCSGQENKLLDYSKYNTKQIKYNTIKYSIQNKSIDTVVVFFIKKIKNKNDDSLGRNYFKKRKEDFSLNEAIYEGLITDKSIKLFVSFFKLIIPNDKFDIYLQLNNLDIKKVNNISNFFMSENVVQLNLSKMRNYFNVCNTCFQGYKNPWIVLNYKDFIN